MMTPEAFKDEWKHSPLVRYPANARFSEGLSEASAAALRDYGLPREAEPWLHFMEFAAVEDAAASLFEERRLFPVGCLANGSFICIEKPTDRLVVMEADDPDDLWILNSSLGALYESMVLYHAFIEEVNRRNPRFASDFRIPHGMLEALREKLTSCDPAAMSGNGFWHYELKALDDSAV